MSTVNTRRLFVVDDDHDTADLLGAILRMSLPNCTVDVAYSGQQALTMAEGTELAAAVLDLEMPGMDGEELAIALRVRAGPSPLLLIALSGNVYRLAGLDGNPSFDHRLSKPTNIDALLRLLKHE